LLFGGGLEERGVSNATDPVCVVVLVAGELAVTQNVPEFEGLVSSGGDNLSVIRGESNAQNFFLVTNESSLGFAGFQVPKSEILVP